MEILQKFKSDIYYVLIATDVAARGLDIKSIKMGSAGDKDGIAYTLIIQKEARFAGELVQNVSMELMNLAMKDGRFRSKHDARKGGGKKGRGRGGGGRGARGVDYGLLVLVLDIIRNPVTLLLLHQTLKVQ
ncbi:hypothetical protein V6N11_073280 [Hibiscus sabdariffa]|uniref:Helicase C-terminal domain-containing protein n=1 Tax=Hibiscus sabdariffa TaxID=183260 RepID=A0ABR2N692_9ROSI